MGKKQNRGKRLSYFTKYLSKTNRKFATGMYFSYNSEGRRENSGRGKSIRKEI